VSLLVVLSACTSTGDVTAPSPAGELEVRAAKVPSAGYSASTLAPPSGYEENYAWHVNDAGYVAIQNNDYSTSQTTALWQIRAGQQTVSAPGIVNGLSSGLTPYITGYDGDPVRWTFDLTTGFSNRTVLDFTGGYSARGEAVNDAGDVAGSVTHQVEGGSGSKAAIWKADGTQLLISLDDPAIVRASARAINNSGDVVIQGQVGNINMYRSWVRLADGTMLALPPTSAPLSVLVRGISERIGTKLYVGGTVDDRNGYYHPARWTIDLSLPSVYSRGGLSDRGTGNSMADDGTLVGEFSGTSSTTPFVWTLTAMSKLSTPKGGSAGRVMSISGDGKYISGDAKFGSYRKAVLWKAP
jgi:hypothetical protein